MPMPVPVHWFAYLGLMILHGHALITSRHGPEPDHTQQHAEIARRLQPDSGPDAWPIIDKAEALLREIEDAWNAKADPQNRIFVDFSALLPNPHWSGDPEELERFRAATAPAFAEARARGIPGILAPLADAPRAVPIRADEPPIASQIRSLTGIRRLARFNRARMFDAAERADWDEFCAAARDTHALARVCAQHLSLIGRIIAVATENMALTEIRLALVERRDIPEPILLRLAADLDAQKQLWPDRTATVNVERLSLDWTVQLMFTDDGRGDGLPILTRLEFTTSPRAIARLQANARTGDEAISTWSAASLFNLFGVTLASKRQTLDAAQRCFDGLARLAPLDRPHRTPDVFDPDAFLDALSRRHVVTRNLLDNRISAITKWLESEDNHALDLLGTRTMLALELYRLRRGRYPDTLAALVPDFLLALDPDPVSGLPLFYKLLDPADTSGDPHGRRYLLYSAGHDRTDNGGKAARNNWAALTPSPRSNWTANTDYIINASR